MPVTGIIRNPPQPVISNRNRSWPLPARCLHFQCQTDYSLCKCSCYNCPKCWLFRFLSKSLFLQLNCIGPLRYVPNARHILLTESSSYRRLGKACHKKSATGTSEPCGKETNAITGHIHDYRPGKKPVTDTIADADNVRARC